MHSDSKGPNTALRYIRRRLPASTPSPRRRPGPIVRPYPASSVYQQAGDNLQRFSDRLTADGKLDLNFGCFLVRGDGHSLLVDTGWGPQNGGRLMQELDDAGCRTDAIDLVLFTHLHGDHTGWNIDATSGRPNFPSARFLVPKGDWDHFSSRSQPAGSFTRDVVSLRQADKVDLIEGEQASRTRSRPSPAPGILRAIQAC